MGRLRKVHQAIATGVLLLVGGSINAVSSQTIPRLRPTSPAAVEQLNQGLALIQSGKLPEAIAAFKASVQLYPQLAPAQYNLGLALRQSGQLQPAADAFYKAA